MKRSLIAVICLFALLLAGCTAGPQNTGEGDTVTFTLERGGNTVTVALVFSSNNDFSLYK